MKYSFQPARTISIVSLRMKPAEMTRSMAGRPKILIVDDNSDVRRLYAIGLNQRGFEVKLASNGAEAVERIAREKPDMILLDWTRMGKTYCLAEVVGQPGNFRVVRPLMTRMRETALRKVGWSP